MATLKEKKRPSIRVRVRAAPDTQQRRGGGLRGCEQRRRYVPAGNWLAPTERCSCPRRVALPGDRSPERWGLHPCGVPAPTAPRAPFGLVFPPLAPPGSNVCSHSRRPASLAPAMQLLSCQGGEAATAPAPALSAGSTLGGCRGRTGCPGQELCPGDNPRDRHRCAEPRVPAHLSATFLAVCRNRAWSFSFRMCSAWLMRTVERSRHCRQLATCWASFRSFITCEESRGTQRGSAASTWLESTEETPS